MTSINRLATNPTRRWLFGACLAVLLATSGHAQQPRVFRSAVDVVPVDLVVVDQQGRPVTGLAAADFRVTVDGQPRKVISAQFLSSGTSPKEALPDLSRPRGWNLDDAFDAIYVGNEQTTGVAMPSRTIVIAIDQSSFGLAAGRRAADAARGLLDVLHATDRVGLSVYPPPGPVVAPTLDRQRLRDALNQVTGLSESFPRTEPALTVTDAAAVAAGSMSRSEILNRVCPNTAGASELDANCRQQVDNAAAQVLGFAQRQARTSLQGLSNVLQREASDALPTTLVVISTGLYGGSTTTPLGLDQELQSVARLAAESRATLYALYVESGFLDQDSMDRGGLSGFSTGDAELRLAGLRDLAGPSGGTVVRVGSGSETSFRRVSLELSAYYLLGIESLPADRNGSRHRIGVRVERPGVIVRSRADVYIPVQKRLAGDEAVREALKAVRLERELPIRLATQMTREAGTDKVRMIISAQIDRGVTAPSGVRVGYAIRGGGSGATTGTSEVQSRKLPVIGSGPEAAFSFVETATLTPGRYLLRLAAIDAAGRLGSVQQVIDATLVGGEGLALSDLLLIDPPRAAKEGFAPVADGRITGDALEAFLEIYPHEAARVESVRFEITDAPGGQPLLAGSVVPERREASRLSASVNLPLGALPAGGYVLNARVLEGERVLARLHRPFRIDRVVGGGPNAALAFSATGKLVRSFAREDALRPEAIDYFAGRLRAADAGGLTAGLVPVLEALRASRFDEALAAVDQEASGQLSVVFLKGLALFGRGQLEPAAQQFRAALRLSNDFLPAAFYLGACYAAGGRDREAVGAWQTSLVSESESRIVYEVLADAWLRLEDARQAEAIITEAKDRWPGEDVFTPRLAAAKMLLKQPGEALAALEPYLDRHPSDAEPLFLAIRLLYEAYDAGKPIRGAQQDRELFSEYAALYEQTHGARKPLVARWLGAMNKK